MQVGVVALIGIQLFRLFGEFIDRDLAHYKRKILCLVFDVGCFRALGGDDGAKWYDACHQIYTIGSTESFWVKRTLQELLRTTCGADFYNHTQIFWATGI